MATAAIRMSAAPPIQIQVLSDFDSSTVENVWFLIFLGIHPSIVFSCVSIGWFSPLQTC